MHLSARPGAGVLITSVRERGPAAATGVVFVGDRVLQVNERVLDQGDIGVAISALTAPHVRLLLESTGLPASALRAEPAESEAWRAVWLPAAATSPGIVGFADPGLPGVRILTVAPGSPAASTGLIHPGDLIVAVNGIASEAGAVDAVLARLTQPAPTVALALASPLVGTCARRFSLLRDSSGMPGITVSVLGDEPGARISSLNTAAAAHVGLILGLRLIAIDGRCTILASESSIRALLHGPSGTTVDVVVEPESGSDGRLESDHF